MAHPYRWPEPRFAAGATLDRPGIYVWEIAQGGCYVGKFTHSSRPLGAYRRNTHRLLSGLPYRARYPAGYRRVHRAMAEAVRAGRSMTLTIVENPHPSELAARERALIASIGTLNDPRATWIWRKRAQK